MMDHNNLAWKPMPPRVPSRAWTDIDQMPDTPTRRAQHRRAHSETFFRFPDLDDILVDDVVSDINLELPPTPPPLLPNGPPPLARPTKTNATRLEAHVRSLSMDTDFFEGLGWDAQTSPAAGAEVGTRHKHRNSMDGYSSATSYEADSTLNKAMAAEKLAELALIDPKRVKRIMANRLSAARSKERKVRYTGELERKVQTLQTEVTTLSAQFTSLQRDARGLTSENKELKLKLQAMEQQAHLKDALNEALRNELERLKISAGQPPASNGLSSQPSSLHYFGHQQWQQPLQSRNNPQLNGQSASRLSFHDFNNRV